MGQCHILRTNSQSLIEGYSRPWHRVVVPARQPTYVAWLYTPQSGSKNLASGYETDPFHNPQLYARVSYIPQSGTKNSSSGEECRQASPCLRYILQKCWGGGGGRKEKLRIQGHMQYRHWCTFVETVRQLLNVLLAILGNAFLKISVFEPRVLPMHFLHISASPQL